MRPHCLPAFFALLVLALPASGALAEDGPAPLGVGDVLAPITLDDQFGEPQQVDARVRLLALSRDMDGGGVLREAMDGRSAEWLAARGVVSLADIDRMPRLVARLFAIPAMRKYPYPLLLDRDGTASRGLPSQPGQATLIALDALRIVSVQHVDSVEAVREVLEALPATEAPELEPEDAPGAAEDTTAEGGS